MDAIKNLFEYKTKAINEIILNNNIVKALSDNTPNFYDNSDQSILNNRDDLLYKHIYPYLPVTSHFVEAKSYITLSLEGFDSFSSSINEGWLSVYIISHWSLIKTDNGQRHGFIANEIDNMIYNTRGFGLGKVGKKRMGELQIGSDFIGVVLKYQITDFAV
jgi:hypothetical protein